MSRFFSSFALSWLAAVVFAVPAWPAERGSENRTPPRGQAVDPGATRESPGGVKESSPSPADADAVTLNFVNADIEGVVKAVSKITGKNFLVDPRVKGTVNIVSGRPISRSLVYDTFLSALRLQGFVAIEERGLVKIVPEADARMQAMPTVGAQDRLRARGDEMRTRVFALKYESAAQLVPILRPLISANNTIAAYPNNNTLVITDYASNLQRIERIVESIDQPSSADPILIPLRHASALDVAHAVGRLFAEPAQAPGAPGDVSQRIVIVPDTRSNSIMARSDNPSRLARLRALVAMLDAPTSAAGNIHVVHLKNAEAVRIAETLRAIYQGEPQQAAGGRPPPGPAIASVTTSMSPSGNLPGAAPAPLSVSAAASSQAGASAGGGIIQADPATNSIIIIAPDAIYQNLRAALEKLDARRAQVYVEALIAEITADKAAEFGIQWQQISSAGSTDGSTRGFGGTNFGGAGQNIIGISQDPTTVGRGLNIGVVRGRVTIPGVGEILNLGLLVRALETDNNANILSTPTLLTLDNEEARIIIGQNVPFITGQYALSGGATTPSPFQTIERRDVGLTLRVKPQISEGGTVRMQIFQEVSSVQDNTNPAGVITNKRAVESTVLVDDGQIIVIGGLIQDQMKDGIEKVPLLGDIPLLGALFQYKTRSRSKTNLMVFLRPTVLRDAQRADPIAGDRYDYIRGEQRKLQPAPSPGLPDVDSPQLPPKKP